MYSLSKIRVSWIESIFTFLLVIKICQKFLNLTELDNIRIVPDMTLNKVTLTLIAQP